MTTANVYTYSEILEMYPYERDAFLNMIMDDEHKKSEQNNIQMGRQSV